MIVVVLFGEKRVVFPCACFVCAPSFAHLWESLLEKKRHLRKNDCEKMLANFESQSDREKVMRRKVMRKEVLQKVIEKKIAESDRK